MKLINEIKEVKVVNVLVASAVIFFLIGVLTTLSFETLRYTKLVEPKMVTMDPKVAYQEMLANPNGYVFLDVRTPGEYANLHASTSINVPIQLLYDQWRTLPRTGKKIYLICTSGRLAGVAYGYLQLHGFTNLVHIRGGIQNWVDEGVPTVGKSLFLDKAFSFDCKDKSAVAMNLN